MKISAAAILLVGMLSLAPSEISATQQAALCDYSVFPASVRDLLTTKFSDWRPKQVSDMDADDQQLWLTAANNKCPGIAVGHFETADELSYAILLVPKSNPSGSYKIVVVSKGVSNSAATWKALDHGEGQAYSGLVISKVPPGKYSDWESTKFIRLKLDGIQIEWMEKGAVIYFWSEGQYRKIRVSD